MKKSILIDKMIIIRITSLILFFGMISLFGQQTISDSIDTNKVKKTVSYKDKAEWLILVYMAGSNDLGILGYVDKNINAMEEVNLTNEVAVVVYHNAIKANEFNFIQFQDGTKTLRIHHDLDINKVTSPVIHSASSYNLDMGNVNNLSRFVIPNTRKFPAKKTMLIVWGQGAGHKGIAYDDANNNYMSIDKLGLVLAKINKLTGKKLDIFATDASFMQMASVAYEIKDYAKVIIGSEESIPGEGYPYKSILTDLNNNPEMNAKELASIIVKNYGDYYSSIETTTSTVKNHLDYNYNGGTTISAVDTSLMFQFIQLLNEWKNAITSNTDDVKKIANQSVNKNIFYFASSNIKESVHSVDLCSFIDHIDKILPNNIKVKNTGKRLRNFITDNLIIAHRGTGIKKGTNLSYDSYTCGLSVYMPKWVYFTSKYDEFIFSRDSFWDDFIKDIESVRSEGALYSK